MQVKKQSLELDMEQSPGSKLGKEYIKGICCSGIPCFFSDPMDVGSLISGSSAFSKMSFEHLEVHGSCTVETWHQCFLVKIGVSLAS